MERVINDDINDTDRFTDNLEAARQRREEARREWFSTYDDSPPPTRFGRFRRWLHDNQDLLAASIPLVVGTTSMIATYVHYRRNKTWIDAKDATLKAIDIDKMRGASEPGCYLPLDVVRSMVDQIPNTSDPLLRLIASSQGRKPAVITEAK